MVTTRLQTATPLNGDANPTRSRGRRLLASAALTVSLLAGSGTVGSPSVSAVVGGVAPDTNGPHVALGRVSEAGTVAFCSGTVIAPYWVLTAAHCVEPPGLTSIDELRIITDTIDVYATPGRAITADEIVLATFIDGFRQGQQIDAALVRMTEPILLSAYPALSRADTDPISQVRTFGFGWNGVNSGKLTFGDRHVDGSQSGFMFTVSHENAMCGGDSGGATMFGDVLVGIDSFIFALDGMSGPTCRLGLEGGGHVAVELLVPWITSTIATPDPPTSCPGLDNAGSRVPERSNASVRVGELAAACQGTAASSGGGRPAATPARPGS